MMGFASEERNGMTTRMSSRRAIRRWQCTNAAVQEHEEGRHAEFVGFLKGNIIKYGMRQGHKEGSDDAAKALHYMQKLNEFRNK
jgi:hypothetical protein